jgi:hypothetical protein
MRRKEMKKAVWKRIAIVVVVVMVVAVCIVGVYVPWRRGESIIRGLSSADEEERAKARKALWETPRWKLWLHREMIANKLRKMIADGIPGVDLGALIVTVRNCNSFSTGVDLLKKPEDIKLLVDACERYNKWSQDDELLVMTNDDGTVYITVGVWCR